MEAGEMNNLIKEVQQYSDPFPWTGGEIKEPTPKELAQRMIDAILGDRVHDNAGEQDFINHLPEEYAAGCFNAYMQAFHGGLKELDAGDVQAFHLIYAHCRVMVNMREGKVLLDKVVDTGGWATVGADWALKCKTPSGDLDDPRR